MVQAFLTERCAASILARSSLPACGQSPKMFCQLLCSSYEWGFAVWADTGSCWKWPVIVYFYFTFSWYLGRSFINIWYSFAFMDFCVASAPASNAENTPCTIIPAASYFPAVERHCWMNFWPDSKDSSKNSFSLHTVWSKAEMHNVWPHLGLVWCIVN